MFRRRELEAEILLRKGEIERLEAELGELDVSQPAPSDALELDDYERYGRQMLVPEIGLLGQIALKRTKVLVVGAGGLGCPALSYLAGAGVGALGVMDHDVVSLSNLPRQTLYDTSSVGTLKVLAAIKVLKQRNPKVQYIAHPDQLANTNVFEICRQYDIILDCTDTPMSRYLLGDATRILGKPLVSASALRTEAQIVVLNVGKDAACYRCLHPNPPDHTDSCSDAGILGPVVGIAGILQAQECINIVTLETQRQCSMTLFSAVHSKQWRTIRIRGRQASCVVCGEEPKITASAITCGAYSYAEFCGREDTYPEIDPRHSISVTELAKVDLGSRVLIDVRDPTQFGICHLIDAVNIPLSEIIGGKDRKLMDIVEKAHGPIYAICRYGNDSRVAVRYLREKIGVGNVYDVRGGLNMWSDLVDNKFPKY